MNTETLLYILICLVIILIICMIFLYFKLTPKDKLLGSMQNSIEDSQQNERVLMMKSQETTTALSLLSSQIRTLNEEFHLLNKGSFHQQENIEQLAKNMNEMQKVMINKKARGNWGEYQLESLLSMYIGNNTKILERQYLLSNGFIGDIALHLPGVEEVMIIDAKFPMENYLNILNHQNRAVEEKYIQQFRSNIKKHIRDISRKYIAEQTIDLAIMFIPSEAIYTFICSYFSDLIDEAYKYHVLMTSPTTLAGVVFTLVNSTKAFYRQENIKEIEKDIINLLDDVQRLLERNQKAMQLATSTLKQIEEVNTSVTKISKRIQKISDGQKDA